MDKASESVFWHSKVAYMQKVNALRFIEEYDLFNKKEGCFVVASNLFPVVVNNVASMDENGFELYNLFIFYKEKPKTALTQVKLP